MEERKLYQQKVEAQLREWNAEIDKLKAKAQKVEADAKLEVNRRLDDIEERYDRMVSRFGELKEAGDNAFDSLKDAFEEAVEEFRGTWKKRESWMERLTKAGK